MDFLAPSIFCLSCGRDTPLPYGPLPQLDAVLWESEEFEGQLELPGENWSVWLICRHCGQLRRYSSPDIRESILHRDKSGSYSDEATCFRALFSCARVDCKSPAEVYIDMPEVVERAEANRSWIGSILDPGRRATDDSKVDLRHGTSKPSRTFVRSTTNDDVVKFLRSEAVRGKLQCGHEIAAIPEQRYKVERMTARL